MSDERRQLRGACLELALERGYAQVSVAALLEATGLEASAFERHYADIEACLIDVYGETIAALFDRCAEAARIHAGWRDQMRALAVATIDFLLEDKRRARFLLVEVVSGSERLRLLREENLARLCELIDRGREVEGAASPPPETALAIAAGIFMRLHQMVLNDELESAYEGIPDISYMIVQPYLCDEAALEESRRPAPRPGEWRRPYGES